jgi:hypothetical protein
MPAEAVAPATAAGNVQFTAMAFTGVLAPQLLADVVAVKPLNAAYLQRAAEGEEVQSEAVPTLNPGPVVSVAFCRYSMSMDPATHAASAADCAACRCNHMLDRSTANPRDASRKIPRINTRRTEACPDSPSSTSRPARCSSLFFATTTPPN